MNAAEHVARETLRLEDFLAEWGNAALAVPETTEEAVV